MTETVVLHIGTHKTGSTSLQQFLRDDPGGLLTDAGIAYPEGLVLAASHSEIPLLIMRPSFMWPARIRLPETRSRRWLAAAERHVRDMVAAHRRAGDTLVLSHEDLSYVREDEELERLGSLLADASVRVVVYLREPSGFLASYRQQLEATGFALSDDPASFAYVAPDSWLVDHGSLVGAYQRHFGAAAVRVLPYDELVAADGSVIPAFTDLLGLPRARLPVLDRYRLNRRGANVRPTPAQLAALRRRLAEQAT